MSSVAVLLKAGNQCALEVVSVVATTPRSLLLAQCLVELQADPEASEVADSVAALMVAGAGEASEVVEASQIEEASMVAVAAEVLVINHAIAVASRPEVVTEVTAVGIPMAAPPTLQLAQVDVEADRKSVV